MSEAKQQSKKRNVHHDEDVDEFVPDEDEMTEVSEYESVKGPALTFGTLSKEARIRIFITPPLVGIIVAVLAVIMTCFYFVPLWDPIDHLDRMKIRIAVQDEGYHDPKNVTLNLGEQFMQGVLTNNKTKDVLGWEFVTGYKADNYTRDSIKNDVIHQKYWAGVIIPKNFSNKIIEGYTQGNETGEYDNAIVYIRDQALQYTTSSIIDRALTAVINNFDLTVRKMLLKSFPKAATAPQGVIYNPVYMDTITVNTIEVVGEYFAHYVPFVILWLCMMTTMWVARAAFRTDYMVGNFALTKHKKYMWFIVVSLITGFFSSLCIVLFLEGLGVKIKEGVVSLFFLYWFTTFTFAGIFNFFLALLSTPGLAAVTILIIFQLVTSDGIYAANTMTANFKGATPFFPLSQAVQLSRTLIFGTALHNRGLHVVVMLIWMVLTWVLSAVCDYFEVGKKSMTKMFPMFLKGYDHFIKMNSS